MAAPVPGKVNLIDDDTLVAGLKDGFNGLVQRCSSQCRIVGGEIQQPRVFGMVQQERRLARAPGPDKEQGSGQCGPFPGKGTNPFRECCRPSFHGSFQFRQLLYLVHVSSINDRCSYNKNIYLKLFLP